MLVCKYKFDNTLYDFIPTFNSGYEGYTITDEIDGNDSSITIRTIECDTLPTEMRFGQIWENGEVTSDKSLSLLEILDMNTSGLTTMYSMFRRCENLTSITCKWVIDNVISINDVFGRCTSLVNLDVSDWSFNSNIVSLYKTFQCCHSLEYLDLSNWNVDNITSMTETFNECPSLKVLDISNWNINSTITLQTVFYSPGYNVSDLQYIKCNNVSTINILTPSLSSRTSSTQGKIITSSSTNVDTTTLSSLNWSVDTSGGTKIAEYVYDKSIYNYFVPEFNEEYSGYFVNDRIEDESTPNIVTRELIGYNGLPTEMRFGIKWINGESNVANNRSLSLLKVLDMNTDNLITMKEMFRLNENVTTINCNWNTSKVTTIYAMFTSCRNLTTLDVSNWNTNNVTDMFAVFYACNSLTNLDVSRWNTSNVTNMYQMFYACDKLTSLDVSNWDTSNVTNMSRMFQGCTNLTQLDVSNWNTSNITNMQNMFNGCTNLTQLNVNNWNTSKVTDMQYMFHACTNLTSLDLSNWDTSKVTNMYAMFFYCLKLVQLDVSNWDTKNVVNMSRIFGNCTNLISLNLSSWNTSKATSMESMIGGCYNLISLDISNFNTINVTNIDNILLDSNANTNIGMLYCSQDTVNKVSSAITSGNKTIWVKDTKASDYTNTEYVAIKDYSAEKQLKLNSPLLQGDKIVKMNGKMYHYHKVGKVVLDENHVTDVLASSQLTVDGFTTVKLSLPNYISTPKFGSVISDTLRTDLTRNDIIGTITHYSGIFCRDTYCGLATIAIRVDNNLLNGKTVRQWVSENPTTVIYDLEQPWYEEISDDTLYLPISDNSDYNVVVNNSTIPTKNIVQNRTFSTIALKTSTIYTVAFDKEGTNEVTIDLGGTTVTTADNIVEIQTPSTLTREDIVFYGDDNISNVRVIEGSLDENAMPKETFEGLSNSYEDGKLPSLENLATKNSVYMEYMYSTQLEYIFGDNLANGVEPLYTFDDTFTICGKLTKSNDFSGDISIRCYDGGIGTSNEMLFITNMDNFIVKINPYKNKFLNNIRICVTDFSAGSFQIDNIKVFEGDWSHLTEEDFNNLGKYKVEYNVVGKNKWNFDKWKNGIQATNGATLTIGDNQFTITGKNNDMHTNGIYTIIGSEIPSQWKPQCHKIPKFENFIYGNVSFDLEFVNNSEAETLGCSCYYAFYDKDYKLLKYQSLGNVGGSHNIKSVLIDNPDARYLTFRFSLVNSITSTLSTDVSMTVSNIQLEFNTTATTTLYEPYKSSTKTLYLNSPLLEGDTIEEIDKKVYHVKRYGKVVLDGKNHDVLNWNTGDSTKSRWALYINSNINWVDGTKVIVFCDKYPSITSNQSYNASHEGICQSSGYIFLYLDNTKWSASKIAESLQENPATVVYRLTNPQYELISEEPLLLDSYANGDLTLDTNITLDKISFKAYEEELTYLYANKVYTLQFYADAEGISNITLGGTLLENKPITVGLNKIQITTPSTLVDNKLSINVMGGSVYISEVVVTDSTEEFNYFEGLKSSFEDCLITDENDENYGKYEVGVKIVGKNLFKGDLVLGHWNLNNNKYETNFDHVSSSSCITVKPYTDYVVTFKEDEGYKYVKLRNESSVVQIVGTNVGGSFIFNSGGYTDAYIQVNTNNTTNNEYYGKFEYFNDKIQLEEGTIATSYEPYKETNATVYLNSPLLKGDRIEVVDGRLCHYHKMGMIVLDGNEPELTSNGKYGWAGNLNGNYAFEGSTNRCYRLENVLTKAGYPFIIDKFKSIRNSGKKVAYFDGWGLYFFIPNDELQSLDKKGFNAYFEKNPTTVIYELAEPYYEDITPLQSSFVISTVSEGDMEILTDLPIKSNITYMTNVTSAIMLEQQLDEIDSSTESLTDILDGEINE